MHNGQPDPLIEQYAKFVYPRPIQDLGAYIQAGGQDLSDPSALRRLFWPTPTEPERLRILVAGCGANQAAIIAFCNPQCHVTGIDLSEPALAHHKLLMTRHRMRNLTLHNRAIEDVHTLGEKYDLIISTGVLHHLRDPAAGMSALAGVLDPGGCMSLMLYGRVARAGVYLVQEALQLLGVERTKPGVEAARTIVDGLPSWHSARAYMATAPDLRYEAGFVDTFLNARDVGYTIPEIFALIESAGLRFQTWLDGLDYSPSAVLLPDSPVHHALTKLSPVERWNVVDLLSQRIGAHRFVVCHASRPHVETAPEFNSDVCEGEWLNYLPILRPGLECVQNPPDAVTFRRRGASITLHKDVGDCLARIDGKTTFRELIAEVTPSVAESVRDISALFWEWGHILIERGLDKGK